MITSQGPDPTSDPADSASALTESTVKSDAALPPQASRKYLVYESCLMELFERCARCQRACAVTTTRLGTLVSVEQLCSHCESSRRWRSQPLVDQTPAGDVQLSAAVYLSGASFSTLHKVFKAMRLQMFPYDTFCRYARMFVEPAVVHSWRKSQEVMLQQLSQQDKVPLGGDMRAHSVPLGGDMRAHSPGHCPKYVSYTTMELSTNTVVDVQLVQSAEVGSPHMEKEGLKRSLALLAARGVTIDYIVTDRHTLIQEFLREENIPQFYDVWHMEKSIVPFVTRLSKKIDKMTKKKGCEKVKRWIPAIRNHVYWTAASSQTGPERLAKWTSLLNHVRDVHTHQDPLFPQCLHTVGNTRDKRKWLSAGSRAFDRLEKELTRKSVLKDIAQLSPHYQASSWEAFQSTVLQFAPKDLVSPYLGTLCRLYLAALHYNENADGGRAPTSSGDPLLKRRSPKSRTGESRARPLKTEATFRYVDDLMDLIMEKVFVDPSSYRDEILKLNIPPDRSSQ
ncbi:uncharacterized protein LOC120562391 isoform X1 [Perca fluviatilis]|uniref:uncharacterized protein LOC120562391 isoform X1 n=1 Tax=Perca fluviatilis TaxID=8168 RepID=UPI001963A5C2|nr:uncharacterized protein LOC120562391 isoform X1 [Perca fluviatilis]